MSNFNIRQWYKGAVAAGLGLAVASLAARHDVMLLFSLGLLLLGVGEWRNHPLQSMIIPATARYPGGVATGEVRSNSLLGVVLAVIGGLVMLASGYRLAVAALQ